jgi:DNA-binding GntR family transcriptional regulator
LQGEGLVVRIPNRGCFVARPDADDVVEIYRVRRLVEAAAVMWGEIREDTEEKVDAIIAQARDARERGDVNGMASCNDAFHRVIVSMTDSPTLAETMDRVLAETRLIFRGMDSSPDFHAHYVERNAQLATRILHGQRDLAAAELREYLDDAERELLKQLRSQGHS